MRDEFPCSFEAAKNNSNQALIELLNEFGSDEAFEGYTLDLVQLLTDIEGQNDFYACEQEIKSLRLHGATTNNPEEIEATYNWIQSLQSQLHGSPNYARYVSLKGQLDGITRSKEYALSASDPAARLLVNSLACVSGVNDLDLEPPFINYKDNTRDVWQYIPNQAVQDYLDDLSFVDTSRTPMMGNTVAISAGPDGAIPVPLSLFINAAGFESWKGRPDYNKKSWHSAEYGGGVSKSIVAIKHYAALPTNLPPVEAINVYIQPDGFIFADNGAGDSHRIGAAFLRGQKEITAETVNFVRLKENHVQLDTDKLSS